MRRSWRTSDSKLRMSQQRKLERVAGMMGLGARGEEGLSGVTCPQRAEQHGTKERQHWLILKRYR